MALVPPIPTPDPNNKTLVLNFIRDMCVDEATKIKFIVFIGETLQAYPNKLKGAAALGLEHAVIDGHEDFVGYLFYLDMDDAGVISCLLPIKNEKIVDLFLLVEMPPEVLARTKTK